MLRINNFKIRKDLSESEILSLAIEKNNIDKSDILDIFISKKSIDARKKDDVHYNYSIDLEVKDESKYKKFSPVKKLEIPKITINRVSSIPPVIVGAGPAGLFAALTLVQNGIKPIVIEQGKTVEERQKDIYEFQKNRKIKYTF